ncbi:hypothetical protein [Euzebya sp.]|uniref:hypothetical protein n=1 Tax=Euzebya sp. TaxID=1971409 RepID=UPI0035178180
MTTRDATSAPATACPSTGALRTHLDQSSAAVESHLDECDACRDVIVGLAADAGVARRLIGALDPVDPSGPQPPARTVSRTGPPASPPAPTAPAGRADSRRPGRRARRWRPQRVATLPALGVVVALAVALVLTPGGRTAVAQFLDTFRGERLQVVQIDVDAIGDLSGLADLGDVAVDRADEPTTTSDPADAEAVSGLVPPDADALIAALGTDATPTYIASGGGAATLTLRSRDGNGVPPALDGAAIRVTVPPAVATLLVDETSSAPTPSGGDHLDLDLAGLPQLVAGRAGAVEIAADGAPLEDIRAFLLARDELPDSLRDQLAGIDDWRHTLPIPVPSDGELVWDAITLDGAPAVAFGDDSGLAAAVIWEADGLLHGLAGPQPRDLLVDLAGSL